MKKESNELHRNYWYFFIGVGVFLFVVQTLYAGWHLNRTQFKDYENISQKPLEMRTEDEKKLMKVSWARYYFTKVGNISFMIGITLLTGSILFITLRNKG